MEGWVMAIYHFSVHVISRRAGRSAVKAAAWRAGERLRDELTGELANFTNRQDVLHSEILMPPDAPVWMGDRGRLWNAVEATEKRIDAQLCREITFAIPHELSRGQALALLRGFCARAFVNRGMVADISLHAAAEGGDQRNTYANVLLTTRTIEASAFGRKVREWNSREFLIRWRAEWAHAVNTALADAGRPERVDHRAGVQNHLGEPHLHLGGAATQMERRGIKTERGDLLRTAKAPSI